MNGVFDLGGTDGLGPVQPSAQEPVFHAEWERPIFTMFAALFRAGWFGVDEFRHGIELMDPAVYLKAPYYEHWLHSYEHHGAAKGMLDLEELDRRTQYYLDNPDAPLPEHEQSPELLDFVNAVVPAGASAVRPTEKEPRFAVGDIVRASGAVPFGHTRLAGYIRGKTGEVIAHRGSFIYPDIAGNGLGENPEHVYTVRFDARELWGAPYADPNGTVCFDVWDPYIELVSSKEGKAA
jgi:nitrile hydratase subunit beta